MTLKLDHSKPKSLVYGYNPEGAKFVQNGIHFDAHGKAIKELSGEDQADKIERLEREQRAREIAEQAYRFALAQMEGKPIDVAGGGDQGNQRQAGQDDDGDEGEGDIGGGFQPTTPRTAVAGAGKATFYKDATPETVDLVALLKGEASYLWPTVQKAFFTMAGFKPKDKKELVEECVTKRKMVAPEDVKLAY